MQNLRQHIGGKTITLADLAGHRATLLQGPRFVGTGADVADQMEAWFQQQGMVRQSADLDRFVDPSFAEWAVAQLGGPYR